MPGVTCSALMLTRVPLAADSNDPMSISPAKEGIARVELHGLHDAPLNLQQENGHGKRRFRATNLRP